MSSKSAETSISSALLCYRCCLFGAGMDKRRASHFLPIFPRGEATNARRVGSLSDHRLCSSFIGGPTLGRDPTSARSAIRVLPSNATFKDISESNTKLFAKAGSAGTLTCIR